MNEHQSWPLNFKRASSLDEVTYVRFDDRVTLSRLVRGILYALLCSAVIVAVFAIGAAVGL